LENTRPQSHIISTTTHSIACCERKHNLPITNTGIVKTQPNREQSRLKEERKKRFEELQRTALAAASAALASDAAGDKSDKAGDAAGDKQPSKAELEARVAYLQVDFGWFGWMDGSHLENVASHTPLKQPPHPYERTTHRIQHHPQELMKSYDDPGPIIDAVVWYDGNAWRSALDTTQVHAMWAGVLNEEGGAAAAAAAAAGEGGAKGALADHPAMADFRLAVRG